MIIFIKYSGVRKSIVTGREIADIYSIEISVKDVSSEIIITNESGGGGLPDSSEFCEAIIDYFLRENEIRFHKESI